MNRTLALLFVLVLAGGLIAFAPLRLAVGMVGLERFGLAAEGVHGTVWAGRLEGATLRGLPLGEVGLGIQPLGLLSGEARLGVRATGGAVAGTAVLARRGESLSLLDAKGEAPLALAVPQAPLIGKLRFEGLSVRFAEGRCAAAAGKLSAEGAPRNLGALSGQVALAGEARCDGAQLLLPLRGGLGGGTIELLLQVEPTGRYRATTRVATAEAEVNAMLRLAGFTETAAGQARTDEGRF